MGTTTFSGPIKAGTIKNTTGTTVGSDVANVGFVDMTQATGSVLQADIVADTNTNIVIPAYSAILSITTLSSAVNTGTNTGIEIGTVDSAGVVTTSALVGGMTLPALGWKNATPSNSVGRIALWQNTGAEDLRVTLKAVNTGSGAFRVYIQYAQALNAPANP